MPVVSVRVSGDVRRLRASLDRLGQQQLPFATMRAVNRTLEDVQAAERAHIARVFRVRRPDFINRLVKIGPGDFATKANLVGRVGIQGPRADILAKFELGGPKVFTGRTIALPATIRLNKSEIIPRGRRPRRLLDNPRNRAFIVRTATGTGLVLQRTGRKQVGPHQVGRDPRLRVVYGLARQAQIPATLEFQATGRAVVRGRFALNLRAALTEALATARPVR